MTKHTNCTCCGKPFKFLGLSDTGNGLCQPCDNDRYEAAVRGTQDPERDAEIAQRAADKAATAAIVVSTEMAPVDLTVTARLGIVAADVAYGQHIGKDLMQSVRDIVGGRSAALQKVIRSSREEVIAELKLEAFKLGANAVIGVSFTITNVDTGPGTTMNLVSATGTAVVIAEGL